MGVLDQPIKKKSSSFCQCSSPEASSHYAFGENEEGLRIFRSKHRQKQHENDILLSEALNKLSFEERQEQQDVLHGVDGYVAEEVAFIDTALQDLDGYLINKKHGSVYEQAERTNPAYVSARAFRIMFLRGSRYDANKAAEKMLQFFEMKQKLFGKQKLAVDITMEDLDDDDIRCLKTGWMRLTGKDSSGRQIIVQLLGIRAWKTMQNELRIRYYLTMIALNSEHTQLRGAVWIAYAVGDFKDKLKGAGYLESVQLDSAIPLYGAAVHFCCDDICDYYVCTLAIKALAEKLRARVRVHCGSHLECQYNLSTYGISKALLPLKPNTYEVDLKAHMQFLHSCFVEERSGHQAIHQKAVMSAFIEPNASDVLYTGGTRGNNMGNCHLRMLVAEWSERYDAGSTEAKRIVVENIIEEIHKAGGRFLKQQVKGSQPFFIAVPLEDARIRITQQLRNYRRRKNGTRKKKK